MVKKAKGRKFEMQISLRRETGRDRLGAGSGPSSSDSYCNLVQDRKNGSSSSSRSFSFKRKE